LSKKIYLIHDKTRGFVGNSLVWWAQDHRGYTLDVNRAHRFTELEAIETVEQADNLVAYPEELIVSLSEPHCAVGSAQLRGKELSI
jgi:hypothetical protein